MAYTQKETGALNDVNELMDHLNNFIATNTNLVVVDYSDYDTGKRLIVSKGNLYYFMYSSIKKDPYGGSSRTYDLINCFMSNSYDLSRTMRQEADNSPQDTFKAAEFQDDIPFYGIYWNGSNIVVASEYENGLYNFLNFGNHQSFGNYDVELITASSTRLGSTRDTYYRPLFENCMYKFNNIFSKSSDYDNLLTYNMSTSGSLSFVEENLLRSSQNELNEKSSLFYDTFFVKHNSKRSPFGWNEDMAFCSAEFLQPQEVFNVGNKEFIFFPFYLKEDPVDYDNQKSRGMGIALRLV